VSTGIFLNTNTVVAKSANYTILNYDSQIDCNSSGGAFTVTLPDPAPLAGKIFIIKDVGGSATANNISIAPHGAETIDGLAANYLLQVSWGTVILQSDGTNWWIRG
jgi:hypothetical protein